MKRIARLGTERFSASDALAGHSELVRLLKSHLPPATVALFAKPKPAEGGVMEWYSELGGQPLPFSQLPPAEAAQVKRLLDERLDSVLQLAARLELQGGDGVQQAALLRDAAHYPDTGTLYSLNGQPVLTFWGYRLKGAPPVELPTPVNPALSPVAGSVPASTAAPVEVPPVAPSAATLAGAAPADKKRGRGWLWLLLLLLLAGLLAALWWFLLREEDKPVVPPAVIEQPAKEEPKPEEPKAEELKQEEPQQEEPKPEPQPEEQKQAEPPVVEKPAEEPVAETPPPAEVEPPAQPVKEPDPVPPLPEPLDVLTDKVKAAQGCDELKAMLKNEKMLQGTDPRAVALKQQLDQKIAQQCKPEPAKPQQAKQQQIQQAKNLCPGQRPPELAPELIIVFDASGSMQEKLPLTAQEQLKRKVTQDVIGGLGGLIGGSAGRSVGKAVQDATIGEPPTRMTAAKEAATAVVRKTPRDTNIGLVMIENCPGARPAGYYSPAQRGSLTGLIQSLKPVGGTPLGDGIAKGGQMLDGVNRQSVMVVISDGQESCGTDPCGVARQLARTKPNLKINVVDIMGTGAGNCVANATGGRVFTAKSVKDLNLMVTQAAQDVLGPGNCR